MIKKLLILNIFMLLFAACDNEQGREDINGYTEILEQTGSWYEYKWELDKYENGNLEETELLWKYNGIDPKKPWVFINGNVKTKESSDQYYIKYDKIYFSSDTQCNIRANTDSVVLTYYYKGPMQNKVGKLILLPDKN